MCIVACRGMGQGAWGPCRGTERGPMYRTWLAGLAAVVVLLVTPDVASAGNPFYGVWTDHLNLTRAQEQADLDRQAATGAGAIREHIFWDRIETTKGVYNFT